MHLIIEICGNAFFILIHCVRGLNLWISSISSFKLNISHRDNLDSSEKYLGSEGTPFEFFLSHGVLGYLVVCPLTKTQSMSHSEKKGTETVPLGYYCYKRYPFFKGVLVLLIP